MNSSGVVRNRSWPV